MSDPAGWRCRRISPTPARRPVRKLGPRLPGRSLPARRTVLSGEQEEIGQEGVDRAYELVGVPVSVKYDDTSSLLDPTSGYRAALLLTPMQSFGHSTATFIISQLSGSAYFDLGT